MQQRAAGQDWDVVVVGGGGAGLAAAIEAARLGRSVVLLEKNAAFGGSTSWSVGSVSATSTLHQRRAGIRDSPQEHFEDMALHAGALAPRDNLVLRRLLVDNTTDMMEWLDALGVVFVGPMPEPPHRYARMHNVVPNSRAFAYHLARRARQLGVEFRLATAAQRFIVADGRVTGVLARLADGTGRAFAARGGVVLASGDYSAGPDLKAAYASAAVAALEAVNATSTGDGHRMALDIGARIVNGDIVRGPILRFVPPMRRNLLQWLPPGRSLGRLMAWSIDTLPNRLLRPFFMSFLTTALGPSPALFREGAIFVNREGVRIGGDPARVALAVPQQPDRVAYFILDAALADTFSRWPGFISTAPGIAYAYLADYRRNRRDVYATAPTLAALATRLGMPPAALVGTVAAVNAERAAAGSARPFGAGPFHALGPVKSYVVFTDGGLAVSARLEVLDQAGTPIPGLFAAGSAGQGGLLLEGHGHHLGWAFISGRIAGRHAALAAGPQAEPAATATA